MIRTRDPQIASLPYTELCGNLPNIGQVIPINKK